MQKRFIVRGADRRENGTAQAKGRTKKAAEQEAAYRRSSLFAESSKVSKGIQ